MLGDDNYGMYLAETPPTEADSEAQVNLAGIYFTGDSLTAVAEGYPWIGRYRPDSLFHVALHVNPALRSFDIRPLA